MDQRPLSIDDVDLGLDPGHAIDRASIVRMARHWIGTPYHHQMSVRGVGTDCLGLVRGIWRGLYGTEPQPVPAYTRDWAEAERAETLLSAARAHFIPVDTGDAAPGDILVFRYRQGFVAKHVGILTGPSSLIHACEGAPVCEIALSPWWRRRVAAAFAFPGITS